MKKGDSNKEPSPSRLIDSRIKELGGWRGEMLARIRAIILATDPAITEDRKSVV